MSQESDQPRPSRIPESLRALRHRNYRLFISGQLVSLTGSWVQNTALGWLVYNVLTHSSTYLGWFNFAWQIPVLVLGLFAGALADSVNRHRLIIMTQFCFMVHAIILTVMTLTHGEGGLPWITYSGTLILALCSGIFQAFDMPARQAFLLQMVPARDLSNAVALNSLTFNIARIVGPSIAGAVIATFESMHPERLALGEGVCFLLNTLTYSAVLWSLFQMRVPQAPVTKVGASERFRYMTDGVRYVKRHQHVRALMTHLVFMALFGIPYLILIPVYAREVLGGQATEFGTLMTAVGVGAVAGGIIMTRRKSIKGLGSHMGRCVFGVVLMLVLLSLNRNYTLAILLLAVAGFFMVMAMIASQTLVQTVLPEDIRGRVMSIYSMISVGCLPFGSLLSGSMAENFGVGRTFQINAVVCAVVTAYFTARLPVLRQSALRTREYRQAIGLTD